MAELSTDLEALHGIGSRRARLFRRMGLATPGDLLTWFPRRYEDRRTVREIAALSDGESVCVRGFVAAPPTVTRVRDGLELLQVPVADGSGVLRVAFFNRPWMKSALSP